MGYYVTTVFKVFEFNSFHSHISSIRQARDHSHFRDEENGTGIKLVTLPDNIVKY